jgi:hypothetical protein
LLQAVGSLPVRGTAGCRSSDGNKPKLHHSTLMENSGITQSAPARQDCSLYNGDGGPVVQLWEIVSGSFSTGLALL